MRTRHSPASKRERCLADDTTVEAQCEVVVPTAPARVRVAFGNDEHLEIVLDEQANAITVDRSDASSDPDAHRDRASADDAFDPSADRPAARIFVDGSIVEVFTSAGRVLTTRVYPSEPPPWRVEASAGCSVYALSVEVDEH